MPFTPHTPDEITDMLATIGVGSIDELFDEIPRELRCGPLTAVPRGMSEMAIGELMAERARQDAGARCFIGAGAYDHHIPAAVWEVATRGEYYSAYTPYQAEASQGTLQLLYEFQSMMTALTAMDASNASLYDGASGLAEAVLMAVRLHRKSKTRRVLMPRTVHPVYRRVVHTIVRNQGVDLVEIPYDPASGRVDIAALEQWSGQDVTALVVPQPNFFGAFEDVDRLTRWGRDNGALVIGLVNPIALAMLKPPGRWGNDGVDIACGEGQPLGAPLASGGPYFGFMCCKQQHIRQMPGRIAGRTTDLDGKVGYTLTLQAREQHIRRSKATSNICTNQGLLVTAATIHMSIMGARGLREVAAASHANSASLARGLEAIEGVERVFPGPQFHEFVVRLHAPVRDVLRAMGGQNILAGYSLEQDYPELANCLLVCATEKRGESDRAQYLEHMERIMGKLAKPPCPVQPTLEVGA